MSSTIEGVIGVSQSVMRLLYFQICIQLLAFFQHWTFPKQRTEVNKGEYVLLEGRPVRLLRK